MRFSNLGLRPELGELFVLRAELGPERRELPVRPGPLRRNALLGGGRRRGEGLGGGLAEGLDLLVPLRELRGLTS